MFKKNILSLALVSALTCQTAFGMALKETTEDPVPHWIANHPRTIGALLIGTGACLGLLAQRNSFTRGLIGAAGGAVLGASINGILQERGILRKDSPSLLPCMLIGSAGLSVLLEHLRQAGVLRSSLVAASGVLSVVGIVLLVPDHLTGAKKNRLV